VSFALDSISATEAGTLPGLLLARCARTPEREAYRQYDPSTSSWKSYSWRDTVASVGRWRASLAREGLAVGERVAILLHNSLEWVCFDQAAQSLGLVVVPLYTTDSLTNVAYILGDSGARLLVVYDRQQWQSLAPHRAAFPALARVLCILRSAGEDNEKHLTFVADWLASDAPPLTRAAIEPHALATIIYTSGTTGRPKGVMLSHHNILSNAHAILQIVPGYREDVYLSFLPLSHAFERTVGYYLPMMAGSTVVFARSVQELARDLVTIRPMVLVSVPRIYERLYASTQQRLAQKGWLAQRLFDCTVQIGWKRFEAAQGRAQRPSAMERMIWPLLRRLVADKILSHLGGRLRLALSGGAALPPKLSHCLIGLGMPLLQGYGLTEAAPIVTGNRREDNVPDSVGVPLPGLEIKLGDKDELLVRGPNVMLGYWHRPQDTAQAIDADGWLHTGDQARIEDGRVYIVGRLKEILVLSTGQKLAPADLELAITDDPLIDQAMVVGEGMSHLAALLVIDREAWNELAISLRLQPEHPAALGSKQVVELVLERIRARLSTFPAYARVRSAWLTLEPWTIDNGLLTPTLKLKRSEMEQRFAEQIRSLYPEHAPALRAEAPGAARRRSS
jgi:long-chain acyl-CoA synthetase